MFLQILVHKTDADYQRIFWRFDSNSEVEAYRLLTVTYGTACVPFFANQVIKQLASDEGANFPLAVSVLEDNIYVDDLMFGADDPASLQLIREQLTQFLMAGGFRTHKWCSNVTQLPGEAHCSERGAVADKALGEDSSTRVLGLSWRPDADVFKFQSRIETVKVLTKRNFLSLLARLFDPLGWVAPVTISGKTLL